MAGAVALASRTSGPCWVCNKTTEEGCPGIHMAGERDPDIDGTMIEQNGQKIDAALVAQLRGGRVTDVGWRRI